LKRRASEFTHFAGQRGSGELDYGSINGDVAAKSGECADYPIVADHRGFNNLAGGEAYHKRDNRPCRKIDVRDLISGLKQNPLMFQMDGFQVWTASLLIRTAMS
jgi:hypothetical protein